MGKKRVASKKKSIIDVVQPVTKRRVCCQLVDWNKHVIKHHPEMWSNVYAVEDTIKDPAVITKDIVHPDDRIVYYSNTSIADYYKEGKATKVVTRIVDAKEEILVTAYPIEGTEYIEQYKGAVDEGRMIYEKPSN